MRTLLVKKMLSPLQLLRWQKGQAPGQITTVVLLFARHSLRCYKNNYMHKPDSPNCLFSF